MSVVVKLEKVSKQFNGKQLLSNINFEVKEGEITTLVGPNGAGKTTLAKLILSIEKPTSGQIIIKPHIKVGYVPQKLAFNPSLPITASLFLSAFAPGYLKNNNLDLLDFIDFTNLKDQNIFSLSGGQMQKLIFVATLLKKPQFLILDEPTKSMDVTSQQEFYKLIENIKKSENLTIFMISHDLFTVIKSSDQVICLNGHVCCSGRPNHAISDQKELMDDLANIGFYSHHHDHQHQ